MPARKEEAGNRYSRLVVLGKANRVRNQIAWMCQCDCGKQKAVIGHELRSGHTKSCGCLERENLKKIGEYRASHRQSETDTYRIWGGMIQRCENPKHTPYPNYGGRGIKVCSRWRDSFEAFAQDMGQRPSKRHSIERKDNDGDYTPDNCFWAEKVEQANNTRVNRMVEVDGKMLTLSEACRIHSVVPYSCLLYRLDIGWPTNLALKTPSGVKPSLN